MAFATENRTSRADQMEKRQQLRELLAQSEGVDELSPTELRMLSRELKRLSHRQQFKAFAESDLARGLLWAAGGMAVALIVLPQLQNALGRPVKSPTPIPQS